MSLKERLQNPSFSVQQQNCLSVPQPNSSAGAWAAWHQSLVRCFGKGGANSLFLDAWDRYGGNSWSVELARYMGLRSRYWQFRWAIRHLMGSNFVSGVGGFFNAMKYINIALGAGIALGFALVQSYLQSERLVTMRLMHGAMLAKVALYQPQPLRYEHEKSKKYHRRRNPRYRRSCDIWICEKEKTSVLTSQRTLLNTSYTGAGDLGMDTTGCPLTEAQAMTAAQRLFDAMDGAGTDENTIQNVTEEAQTRACWNKIALAYSDLTDGENLRDRITNELESIWDNELEKWEDTFTTLR